MHKMWYKHPMYLVGEKVERTVYVLSPGLLGLSTSLWLEDRDGAGSVRPGLLQDYLPVGENHAIYVLCVSNGFNLAIETRDSRCYGVTWRAWSAEPTGELILCTPWLDDKVSEE